MTRGLTAAISASSHGKHASISTDPGLLWIRRGPRGTPFEMLHHISHVSPASIDTGLDEAAVEQLAGRADEGLPCSVLDISRLLPDQHDHGCLRPLAEDGLSGVPMQVTCRALGSGLAQTSNGWLDRNKLIGGAGQ